MKLIIRSLSKYKKESILSPFLKLLEALLDLITPLIIADIIDNGINTGNESYIIKRFIYLLAMAVIGIIISLIAQYFAAKAAIGSSSQIRRGLFNKIQALSYSNLDIIGTPSLITNMTDDVTSIRTGVNIALRLLLRAPVIVFGALICSFIIDIKTGCIFSIAITLLFFIVFLITNSTLNKYVSIQENTDTILTQSREALQGARVIKVYTRENDEIDSFKASNKKLTKLQIFTTRISTLLNPLTYLVINFAIIALLKNGSIQISSGLLTTGQVVALYNYLSQILVELVKFSNLIITESRALAASKRIQKILDINVEKVSTGIEKPTKFDINLTNAELTYKTSHIPSLEDVNINIPYGSKIGIIGGTGSGKTSLINLLQGKYKATKGKVTIGETDISNIDEEYLNSEIFAYAPQHAQLFSGTVRDNIQMNKELSDDIIIQALTDATIYKQIEGKGGINYEIGEGGNDLSGGQKQRLTIARAFAQNAKILILDDSFSALDYATEKQLRNLVLNKDSTVIIVSQRISSIRYCDKIIVLDDGKIVGFDNHDNLINNCDVYREIYMTQVKEDKWYEQQFFLQNII